MNLAKLISFAKEGLSTKRSAPLVGEIAFVKDTGQMYIFNGTEWIRVTYALLNDRSDVEK